jgi:PKD repeat protein
MEVFTMPSSEQSATYGNAVLGEPITVWGAVRGGTGPYTYTLEFGDGSSTSGSVSDPEFIGTDHTYTSAGVKTMKLTVTDSLSTVRQSESQIRVYAASTQLIRVNMAIARGLLYLYKNQHADGYWYNGSSYRRVGNSSLALLAFEENGHLPGNINDVYAERVRKGVNWLLTNGYGGTYNIYPHSDGLQVRDPDSDGDGIGAYLISGSHSIYAFGCALMAVVASLPDAAAAQAEIIQSGAFQGWSYYDLVVDCIDMFAFCQGDGSNRGGWRYSTLTTNSGIDGSASQWPVLAMLAAELKWGLAPPQWVKDNALYTQGYLQGTDGGFGYTRAEYWVNSAKTGGGLVCYAWLGVPTTDQAVAKAIQYLGNSYLYYGDYGSGSTYRGWSDFLYGMYSMKKGLETIDGGIGVETLTTPAGVRNWYDDFVAFLLGDAAGLPPGLSYRASTSYAFGQEPEGSWYLGDYPCDYGDRAVCTAWGVLILTKGVVVPPPVAQVLAVSDQPPNTSFTVDGSTSFHMDSSKTIIEWLWDFDAGDGLDWDNPDASGPMPVNPGYAAVGQYVVTLLVTDDGDPTMSDTDTITVEVTETNHPPVAVAIPVGQPSYAGTVGVPIPVDGSSSYDPDPGDSIVSYSWDLDGDGQFDDATTVVATVTFQTPGRGQVGLRVTDTYGLSSENIAYIDIVAALDDIYVASFTAGRIPGDLARVDCTFRNDAQSQQGFEDVVVRFYDDNPFTTGNRVGDSYTVDLPVGGSANLQADLPLPPGIDTLFVLLDAPQAYAEWNETNNLSNVELADQLIKDATPYVDASIESWFLYKQTGTFFGTLRMKNISLRTKLHTVFWYAFERAPDMYLVNPDGITPDGKEYVDITTVVETALMSVGNRDKVLDPGEEVTVFSPKMEVYSRTRIRPDGDVWAIWSDPPGGDNDGKPQPSPWEELVRLLMLLRYLGQR